MCESVFMLAIITKWRKCLESSSGSKCLSITFCMPHSYLLFWSVYLLLFSNFIIVYNNCFAEDSDVAGYQPLECDSDYLDGEWYGNVVLCTVGKNEFHRMSSHDTLQL